VTVTSMKWGLPAEAGRARIPSRGAVRAKAMKMRRLLIMNLDLSTGLRRDTLWRPVVSKV
jgi:hypothetical protein